MRGLALMVSLALFGCAPKAPPAGASAVTGPPAPAAGSADVDWLSEEDGLVVLQQDALPNPEELARWFRALPHAGPDGDTAGFVLSGIRDGSPPAVLGLRDGDVVHRIAGSDITTMSGVLEAWTRTQEGGTFEIELTRDGAPRVVRYTVR